MPHKEVRAKTLGEIRSFLDEISNGTSRYRSLHNLTEQVEHQYHGRFLIELIQNAHDALFEEGEDTPQRIEIVIAEDEHPHGALYIANDGQPFTLSNFEALSNLGQSDKDPQKSIGNKGIGFRSVLEITKAPEIYSRNTRGSSGFDGYCFSFMPDVIQMFEGPVRRVVEGENSVDSPEALGAVQLLEWDDARYKSFRKRCQELPEDWLSKELAFLSPYTLPIPMETLNVSPRVKDFERRKFSTVIRLPFHNERAMQIAKNKLEEMDESTVIFLHRVNMFRLICNSFDRCYKREQAFRHDDPEEGFAVLITADEPGGEESRDRRYWLWKRTIGGEKNPSQREEIKSAVVDLPGKWPKVDEATVEIAVQVGNAPDDGVLNIYLPTQVPSGCAANFSAPFFGDMSRTNIDFDLPFNSLLLNSIAEKGVDVILESLSGKGEAEAAAIIDVLAPTDSDEGQRWWTALEKGFCAREIEIESLDIALSDEGWRSFGSTRLLPALESDLVINAPLLRSEVTYPVFVQGLREREVGIRRLFEKKNISPEAMPEDNAATVEAIARKLHGSQEPVDWSGFWQDVAALFGGDSKPLIGKSVFLGTDNRLHASDNRCSVFFRPRRGGFDDDVLPEGRIDDIPESLRPFIAFLNEEIQTHNPRAEGGFETTALHRYLSGELVQSYGVERIFSGVLVKATPKLPHNIDGPESRLCRDILEWGLRLLKASKHSMDEPIRLLSKLPAPCLGGWYPINETSFGPGWPEKSGADLDAYLRRVGTPECTNALERLLLPPDHPLWSEMGLHSVDLLEKAGAFNGIRLVHITEKDWNPKFSIAPWKGVELPEKGPPYYSSEVWGKYRQFTKSANEPNYATEFDYQIEHIHSLPGLEKFDSFDDNARELLMKLLLVSIPTWAQHWKKWKSATIRKIRGEADSLSPASPLKFFLRQTRWMLDETDEKTIRFRPSDRWHIPSPAQLGGIHQFSHLMTMPVSVNSMLSGNLELTESMKELGMPSYEPDEDTADPRLLNDLADALQDPKRDISNSSVFLGQVRTAWNQFNPGEENRLPSSVIVQNGSGPLIVVRPSEKESVYLPNATSAVHNGLELHSKPVVVMYPKDAKRLQDRFRNAYDGVRLASELTTKALVDGHQWQAEDNSPQLSEELPWLIPVVLSIFAFSGERKLGIDTKTFKEAIDALRRTRIVWVNTLEVDLWDGEVSEARTDIPALWLPKDNTLLAISDARNEVSQLSEALASIVVRSDIDIPLKLVLGYCEKVDEITEDVVCVYLKKLHITADHYQEVQQRWLGDLAWKVRLIRPLILLMHPNVDIAPLDDVSSEEQFRDVLQFYNIAPDLFSIVRNAAGLKSVGYKAWKILGEKAQLHHWNKVLSQLSEPLVSNDKATTQFQEHMDSCRMIMRSIIRHTMRKHPESRGFKDFEDELLSLECPREYAENYWVVDFPEVMKKVRAFLVEWDTDSDVVVLVEKAASAEELREQLAELGLEPDLDPIEIQGNNHEIFYRVLKGTQKAVLAWCIRENIDEGMWGEDNGIVDKQLADDFAKAAFVERWDEPTCFKLIGKLNQSQVHKEFWTALGMSSTVSELRDRLEISDVEWADVRSRLVERKQKQELQKKTVNVCGADFVNSEENLNKLWDHILEAIEDDSVVTADLSDLEELKEQGFSKKRNKDNTIPTNKKKSKGRMSQAMKDLVGRVGEIHAFRALQKFYGVESVGPSSWISENSRYKYPENTTEDGYGCDFRIHKDGKIYYVEVKATQTEDETFELGSSEVELAIDSANRRKKEFVILHVLDALSKSPQFRMLPNPYDKKYRNKYKFEEAGLRVRYETT